jgi:ABC-type Na+ efflux pump permease subunit
MQHRAFSPRRIAAIAGNTFRELTRLKVFYALVIFALVLIGSSLFMARLTFQQEFQVLKDVSLGAMSIFSSLLAIVTAARLLPQDTEDKTVYAILAKPVPRSEYVTGKLLGVVSLLAVSIAVMAAMFVAVLYLRQESAATEITRQMAGAPAEQMADALRELRAATFSTNLIPGIAVILVKACLLAALTIFVSTLASSSIFTIAVTVFVYFIGHLQATAREYWLQEQGAGWLHRAFLGFVALLFPDLHLFDFADEIVTGAAIPLTLFLQTIGLGCYYIVIYLLLAVAVFNTREL